MRTNDGASHTRGSLEAVPYDGRSCATHQTLIATIAQETTNAMNANWGN